MRFRGERDYGKGTNEALTGTYGFAGDSMQEGFMNSA